MTRAETAETAPRRRLRWVAAGPGLDLSAYRQVDFALLRNRHRRLLGAAEAAAAPGADWLRPLLGATDRPIAVTNVTAEQDVLEDLLGHVVDPAWRTGSPLVVAADHRLDELDDAAFLDPDLQIPLTLERLRYRFNHPRSASRRRATPDSGFRGDDDQSRAISAPDGVVQVLAAPGAGKTTVLVERVCELRRRGARPGGICCLTFSRAAAAELRDRLVAAEAGAVAATTFHGLAWRILRRADASRWPDPGGAKHIDAAQWSAIVARTRRDLGPDAIELSVPDIRAAISAVKRDLLCDPDDYWNEIASSGDRRAVTVARLYHHYEREMRRNARASGRDLCDHDDLLLGARRVLAEDDRARHYWQRRARHLLVDEYQDIDHAQEQLMRVLAAPQDSLFCVADEDQALYGFRGASVQRTITLDRHYPTLQRIVLGTSYRCPPAVIDAARQLIAYNTVRFPKPLRGVQQGPGEPIAVHTHATHRAEALAVARRLEAEQSDGIVVLARTWNQLRPVADACAQHGVTIDGNGRLFSPARAHVVFSAYLRLAVFPREADAGTVRAVCAAPLRVCTTSSARIASKLRRGVHFVDAFADVGESSGALPLGELLDRVATGRDAGSAVALLIDRGGLGTWLEGTDLTAAQSDLASAAAETADRGPIALLAELDRRSEQLATARAVGEGIELATIHQSKGRQWPTVVIVGVNDGRLPHQLSGEVSAEPRRRGDGVEAERRLFYVALTRAQRSVEVHCDRAIPSPFLAEAGLQARSEGPAVDPSDTAPGRERDLPSYR